MSTLPLRRVSTDGADDGRA